MNISVVVPVYNAERTIALCLESLLNQNNPPYEMILVDNNSPDNSFSIIKTIIKDYGHLNIILEHEAKAGVAAARNRGIAISSGDIIAFLDSDCVAREDWIRNIEAVFVESPYLAAVGGITEGHIPSNVVEKFIASTRGQHAPAQESVSPIELIVEKNLPTLNAAYKRSVLYEMGLFNEAYFVGEDTDMYLKVLKKGYKVRVWDERLLVRHIERNTLRRFIKRIAQYRYAEARNVKEHFRKQMIVALPFRKIIHRHFPVVVWIPALMSVFTLFFWVLYVTLFKSIVFPLVILLLEAFVRTLLHLRKTRIEVNLKEFLGMSLVLLFQKITSLLTKVYSSFRYRIIFL